MSTERTSQGFHKHKLNARKSDSILRAAPLDNLLFTWIPFNLSSALLSFSLLCFSRVILLKHFYIKKWSHGSECRHTAITSPWLWLSPWAHSLQLSRATKFSTCISTLAYEIETRRHHCSSQFVPTSVSVCGKTSGTIPFMTVEDKTQFLYVPLEICPKQKESKSALVHHLLSEAASRYYLWATAATGCFHRRCPGGIVPFALLQSDKHLIRLCVTLS